MGIHARERVRHLWFIDPLARTLEVYRLDGAHGIAATRRSRRDRGGRA